MNADARIHSPHDRHGTFAPATHDGRAGSSTGRDGASGSPRPGGVAVSLAAASDAPTLARHAAEPALAGWGADRRDAAMLVISELVTNAVRHGAAGPEDRISLRIRRCDHATRIEVADPRGHDGDGDRTLDAFAAADRSGAEPLRAADRPGGWGLPIVAELTNRWGVDRGAGRTCVWCEIDDA